MRRPAPLCACFFDEGSVSARSEGGTLFVFFVFSEGGTLFVFFVFRRRRAALSCASHRSNQSDALSVSGSFGKTRSRRAERSSATTNTRKPIIGPDGEPGCGMELKIGLIDASHPAPTRIIGGTGSKGELARVPRMGRLRPTQASDWPPRGGRGVHCRPAWRLLRPIAPAYPYVLLPNIVHGDRGLKPRTV
jgi:hypothetical protein